MIIMTSSYDIVASWELLCYCLTTACHDSRDVTSQQYHVTTGCGATQLQQAGEAFGEAKACPGQEAPQGHSDIRWGQPGTIAQHGRAQHNTTADPGPPVLHSPSAWLPSALPQRRLRREGVYSLPKLFSTPRKNHKRSLHYTPPALTRGLLVFKTGAA